jgi:hypothetical protein
MDVLTKQRVAAVHVTGDRRRSKLAFKFTVLRQSFTYRLVDLGDGTIDQWQAGNTLVCIVLARAFFETVAVVDWISGNLRKLLDSRNVKGLDRLAMQGLFGAKSKFWQMGDTDSAINVLTALDHLSKELPEARDRYERISDICPS